MPVQEEISSKEIALIIKSAKITGSTLFKLAKTFRQHNKNKQSNDVAPKGKMTVKELANQGQGLTTLDMNDNDIKYFDRIMRKYGVDYAVMIDKKSSPPVHTIFFKGKDADAINKAFEEITKNITKQKSKKSVLTELRNYAQIIKTKNIAKVKNKEKEMIR